MFPTDDVFLLFEREYERGSAMTEKRLWNDGWLFLERPFGTPAEEVLRESEGWKAVDLPHDWLIYDAADLYRDGEGWYRKSFSYEPSGRRVSVRFDGVYMDCTVYVNRAVVYEWKYGYSAFEFDITEALVPGENEIFVQVRFQSPNSRW